MSLQSLSGRDLLTEGEGGGDGRPQGFWVAGKEDRGRVSYLSPWMCCFGEDTTTGNLTSDVQQAGRDVGAELERENLEGIFFL